MKLLSKIIVAILLNAVSLWLLSSFIPGISLTQSPIIILEVALILTALNFFLRPILKLILAPLIFLTLGLGLLILNGFMLYLLDIFAQDLSIQGIPALFYATLITSAINFVFHISTKST